MTWMGPGHGPVIPFDSEDNCWVDRCIPFFGGTDVQHGDR